jgi:pentatricopeptide repeat protein
MEKLVKTFQKKYKVAGNNQRFGGDSFSSNLAATDEALLVLIERHAQDGNALRALRVFQMSKTLAEKEAAWNSLIAAHARAGAGRVRECGALLEGMAERGLVPNVVLFNVALTASATLKKEEARASVDRILALMKKLRVVCCGFLCCLFGLK